MAQSCIHGTETLLPVLFNLLSMAMHSEVTLSTVAGVTLAVTRAAALQTLLRACQGGPSSHSEALGGGGGQHDPETLMSSRGTATALHVER